MHPEIQEKAVKELEDVYEDEDTESDFDRLSRLPYLEMIVKEASTEPRKWSGNYVSCGELMILCILVRLYPVAPFLSRKCSKDTQISKLLC